MKNTWLTLCQDFSSNLGFKVGVTPKNLLLKNSISEFRDYTWPLRTGLPAYHLKCEYQLENFLKRYRFENDRFDDAELQQKALQGQLDNIARLSKPFELRYATKMVLQHARQIITKILGSYDEEEHLDLCRFGKRASVGSPYSKSYLDLKVRAPFEASSEHISWFKNLLVKDQILNKVVQQAKPKGKPLYKICKHLTNTNVPKSYKSLRSITKNTTIGAFHSYGLGMMITSRLKDAGLNIKVLQHKHGIYARRFSRTRTHVTADLSAASDSITLNLLMYLIPRSWLRALKLGQIRTIQLTDGSIHQTPTFCGMGIGFTFPLETLVFYGLLTAIKELTLTKGLVSVYGDDLIYPRRIHSYVSVVFPDLGLTLNQDKTYTTEYFRESCGSDYYHGIDVRPVSPDTVPKGTAALPFSSFIYQLINSLLRKWDRSEIPITLHYLEREVLGATGHLLRVPPSFPDYSGIRCEKPKQHFTVLSQKSDALICIPNKVKRLSIATEWYKGFVDPKFNVKRQTWTFYYLGLSKNDRPVTSCYPYYWDTLRQAHARAAAILTDGSEIVSKSIYTLFHKNMLNDALVDFVDEIVSDRWENPADSTALRWVKLPNPSKNYRSKISGKRLRQLIATVEDKSKQQRALSLNGATTEWC
jgi:hypothetical protein